MTEEDVEVPTDLTTREKARAIYEVARFRPRLAAAIILGGMVAATLAGLGISFILPIVELVQNEGAAPSDASGPLLAFVVAYRWVGVPLTLETVIVGFSLVMTVRFTVSFVVAWLRSILKADYVRHLQTQAFRHALDAEVAYFDRHGSDKILNTIVTQTRYASHVIQRVVFVVQKAFLGAVYIGLALVLAPVLTLLAAVGLGSMTYLMRSVVESGVSVGDRVADANEEIQTAVQGATQGIRDVKLFGLRGELFGEFQDAVDKYVTNTVQAERNQAAINNYYQLAAAITLFVLVYLGITFAALSLGMLGVFLFAMFRLSPVLSNINERLYRIESDLPHLVRTQEFVETLEGFSEPESGNEPVPAPISTLAFEDVTFGYDDEPVLEDVSFTVDRGEFVAFVGQSGAGKSTIVSLLARMYDPDEGRVLADGVQLPAFDLEDWRSRVAVVRQSPFVFNDTLLYNLTLADRDASMDAVEEACRIACVDEFVEGLPNGYDTVLGDQGVQLSGGQRQRVALARALLKDADVLLLDEATSDLDSTIEARIQERIESMDREQAIVAIAHRLSTVKNADRIHTVSDGEIVESGEHGELIARDGEYSALYSIQSR